MATGVKTLKVPILAEVPFKSSFYCTYPYPHCFEFLSYVYPIMHMHKMINMGYSLKIHLRTVLSLCVYPKLVVDPPFLAWARMS